ncbi:ArsR/SmtB family transcription factor [Nocardiopsis potens]|uniref:ArsR/SmtB family transcription factor n=1 Tax=Nocardiopsis potens TaxID=1246458 RepID=UPI000344D91F|nr:winged helix-turn-helix domain-containing protein [Nocardiopsis potens]
MNHRTDPGGGPDLARVAALLADGTRAAFCLALLDGRAWTAAELAGHAGVARSTASEHLTALVGGGLLREVRQGRHRYLSLASPRVAEVIEALSALAPGDRPQRRSLSAVRRSGALSRARTCYDHLAGALGVAIADAMRDRGLVDAERGPALTDSGAAWFADLGIDLPRRSRRPALLSCLDWTERRPHLAGALGAALCSHAFAAGWVVRPGPTRAVAVTGDGHAAFRARLGLPEEVLAAARG